jgi:hypothetical protein
LLASPEIEPDVTTESGNTPMHCIALSAVDNNLVIQIVKLLVMAGASVSDLAIFFDYRPELAIVVKECGRWNRRKAWLAAIASK